MPGLIRLYADPVAPSNSTPTPAASKLIRLYNDVPSQAPQNSAPLTVPAPATKTPPPTRRPSSGGTPRYEPTPDLPLPTGAPKVIDTSKPAYGASGIKDI